MSESQNIEYKESWRDEYLKWICGFANAQGGRIYIGVNDNQKIVGIAGSKRLMEDIPNKIVNYLGIVADVNLLHSNEGKEYIEIIIEPSNVPIAYHGQYHYRSGSTKQELKGAALQQFILKKMGRSWDDIPNESAKLDDIDRNAIDYFLRKAVNAQRIDPTLKDEDTQTVLHNLRLLSDDGHLKNAALLLFGKEPLRFFPGVEFRIGRFGMNEADLIFQDVVEGNILQMADKVIALLRSKYLISPIHYEGMQRIEPLEVPEDALREMIYNSLVHKLYVGVPIQMWVFNDHIELWNEGKLPDSISIDALTEKHSSHPRNLLIASVFYKAGFIESWGRGIRKINDAFDKAGLEKPKFEESEGGLLVTFKRNYPLMDDKRINVTDNVTNNVTDRYKAILSMMNNDNKISTTQIATTLKLSKRTVLRDISILKERQLIERIGMEKTGYWLITKKGKKIL